VISIANGEEPAMSNNTRNRILKALVTFLFAFIGIYVVLGEKYLPLIFAMMILVALLIEFVFLLNDSVSVPSANSDHF
jgi:hypothetical protein